MSYNHNGGLPFNEKRQWGKRPTRSYQDLGPFAKGGVLAVGFLTIAYVILKLL